MVTLRILLSGLLACVMSTGSAHQEHGHGAGQGSTRPAAMAWGTGAAWSPAGELWLVHLDAQGQLLSLRRDATGQWSAPRALDTGGERIAADGENRPKIAFGPSGQVVISYTRPLAKPYTGEIRLLRSVDGGASFAPPITVHADRQIITHRFESISFDTQGRLHVVWIDKRDLERARQEGRRYRGAAIYRVVSTDGGAHFGPDTRVADHACECCRIALAPAPDGSVGVMWRHVFAPNVRDHAFSRIPAGAASAASEGGTGAGAGPARATTDQWAVDACPHHGPGLAVAGKGDWHAVWYGQKAGVGRVAYGRLSPDGQLRGPARDLPDATAEHADVAALGARVVLVWRGVEAGRTVLRAGVSDDEGRQFEWRELHRTVADNDHPRLVTRPGGIDVVWRTGEGIHVQQLVP